MLLLINVDADMVTTVQPSKEKKGIKCRNDDNVVDNVDGD